MNANLERLRGTSLSKLLRKRHDALLNSIPGRSPSRRPLGPWKTKPDGVTRRDARREDDAPPDDGEV